MKSFFINAFTIVAIVFTLWSSELLAEGAERRAPLDFKGRALVSISDADMVASAYVDGKLGEIEGQDALSVIDLSKNPTAVKATEVSASNSVAGPPASLALSTDGKYALVAETMTQRPKADGTGSFGDLNFGKTLRVFDISNRAKPTLIQEIEVGPRPQSVSVNFKGNLIAVALNPENPGGKNQLVLVPFLGGKLGKPAYFDAPAIPVTERLISAQFHPTRDLLGLLNETRGELSFVQVSDRGKQVSISQYGNKIQVGKAPYLVKFTPNGKFAVVNNLYWGPDVDGTWVEAPRGNVVSVQTDEGKNKDGFARHALISQAPTSVSPEGLAISPDGSLVATTNLERSYLPYQDSRITWYSSISLITLDQNTGRLSHLSDYRFEGILPEAAAFDASSKFLAVATFDHFDDSRKGGSIDFFRVVQDTQDPAPHLVKTVYSLPVSRGPHTMFLIP